MSVLARFLRGSQVVVLSSVLLITSCGGDSAERNYAVPSDLCGLDVPRDLYDPVFPPGSQLAVEDSFDLSGPLTLLGDTCTIEVDGSQVVHSATYAWDSFDKVSVGEGEGEAVSGAFNAMVWPGVAMAQAPCTIAVSESHHMTESFMISLEMTHPEGDEESVEVLSQLIQPYMAAAIDGVPCEERAG
ncbi:hypothetical protein AB0O69_21510 [Streptomyces xiamenensis]|uniref:hypothetical protein n=1 Tax=Streptomyces xiamenensis TaxID=408015 RepID=UPI0034208B27